MMRLFGTLFISSTPSKQPLRVLERSLAAYLVTIKRSTEHHRFFSDQPSLHPQDGIRVVSIQHVKPNKPTPKNLRSFKLWAIDQLHLPYHVPFIFFYRNNNVVNGNTNIENMVRQRSRLLKESLSETLTWFYPFAGKYYDVDNHIDCNDEGVYYIETQVDGNLTSFLTKPDYKLLQGFLPKPPNPKEPTPRGSYLVMVQVNFFKCGGVAISTCNSHKLMDGGTVMTFLNTWASVAKGHTPKKLVYPNFALLENTSRSPTYPSHVLSFLTVRPSMLRVGKCLTKRFVFNDAMINELKIKAKASRVVAITTLIWKCATTASRKQHGEEKPSVLLIPMNIRGRFSPPFPPNAIGNIIWSTPARLEYSNNNLRLDSMAGKMNASIAKIDTKFLERFKGENGYANVIDEIQKLGRELSDYDTDYYSSSSMCKSGAYEADFGWGKPVWCCFADYSKDDLVYKNTILLMDTSSGDGIEVWVTLSEEEMGIFERDPEILSYSSVEPSSLAR